MWTDCLGADRKGAGRKHNIHFVLPYASNAWDGVRRESKWTDLRKKR